METCWIISNITAGTPEQIGMVIKNQELLTKLISLSTNDFADVQREAIWAICNSTKLYVLITFHNLN